MCGCSGAVFLGMIRACTAEEPAAAKRLQDSVVAMRPASVRRFDPLEPSQYTHRMAIQFNCPGCQQPVEVDDEWAGQHVACPFCHRVVTTPNESTLASSIIPPTARRLSPSPDGNFGAQPDAAIHGHNTLAKIGFGFSLVAVLLLLLGLILLAPLVTELGPDPQMNEDNQKKILEMYNNPQTAGPLFGGSAAFCLSFGCWIAGLVMSAIAVTRKDLPGRRWAFAGLGCASLIPLMYALGSLFG